MATNKDFCIQHHTQPSIFATAAATATAATTTTTTTTATPPTTTVNYYVVRGLVVASITSYVD